MKHSGERPIINSKTTATAELIARAIPINASESHSLDARTDRSCVQIYNTKDKLITTDIISAAILLTVFSFFFFPRLF